MTAVEAARIVGKVGRVSREGLGVEVRILDVKESYGRTRYLVTPVAGTGAVWVEYVRLENEELGS